MNSEQDFNIFVVEDNEWYNKLLVHTLSLNPEYTVKSFFSGEDMMKQLTESIHVVTLDYRLPDTTGDVLLKKIKEASHKKWENVITKKRKIKCVVFF